MNLEKQNIYRIRRFAQRCIKYCGFVVTNNAVWKVLH